MEDRHWREIEGVPPIGAEVQAALSRLAPLKSAWEGAATQDPEAFQETRRRLLRSHAIETGVIERLYDVDWGVTEALVAEGISRAVIEQSGGSLGQNALNTIHDQHSALEFVSEAARGDRPLSVQFIRELHQLITKHQATYDATDSLGRPLSPELRHGEWKVHPNHVTRPDGSLLQYCPPERVQDQMEALASILANDTSHAVIRAAWLHHSFILIHPFQDGNGRVARALVLLELLRGHFAPLVVGRDIRETYIRKLDEANEGDLDPLILLFADLERQAMVRQFQEPLRDRTTGSVLDVARAAAANLADLQRAARQQQSQQLAAIAIAVNGRMTEKLEAMRSELESTFKVADPGAAVWVRHADIGDAEATHYHGQIARLARRHQFFANLSEGTWWTTLTIRLLNQRLVLLATVAKVGSGETGVGQVMVAAERKFEGEDGSNFEWLLQPTELDQVSLTGELSVDDIWPDVSELLDRFLSAGIFEFTRVLA